MSSLQGRRIVITRPRHQSSTFEEFLKTKGARPILFPTIQISPIQDTADLDRALKELSRYDWLVLTSTNAVQAVWTRLNALGIKSLPKTLQVAAIGPKTAASLETYGVHPNFVPDTYIAESILPGLGDLQSRWVLLPLADIAHDTLPNGIRSCGGIPDVITAYHTLPANPNPKALDELRKGVDAITFTSGSSVRNFLSLSKHHKMNPLHLPGDPVMACIGPKTAKVARQAGLTVNVVAKEYTIEGLVDALLAYFTSPKEIFEESI
ncbi:MAG: uroporphyrinogen-III synthase [Anaerolineales bacterium]|jgi:uroporphyrinogen III methyltransferase/synthase